MPAISHIKQQLCPWCALRRTFAATEQESIVVCPNCGQAAVREGQFLRRCTVKDTAELSTDEVRQIVTLGEIIRQDHSLRTAIRARKDLVSIEPHLTIRDVATRWQMCVSTVQQMFEGEAGIIRFGPARKRFIRIPLSIVERVHARLEQS